MPEGPKARTGTRNAGFLGAIHCVRSAEHVSAFLTALATVRGVAARTQNQALSAIVFWYGQVLGLDLGPIDHVPRAKAPSTVPVVLTREEVHRVLAQMRGVPRLVASLLYGGGLRLHECLELRVKDVNFERREIVVRREKGQKDRRVMLPEALREGLARHLDEVQRMHERDQAAGGGRVVPSARGRVRHPYGTGATWARGRHHDDGVYPRPKSRAVGSAESGGSAAGEVGHQAGRAPSGSAGLG